MIMEVLKTLEIICAVDKGWNIGYCGHMLCRISNDLKRFKQLTTGHIIIMGRKTLESLPGGQALPGRINIVLTRNKEYKQDNAMTINSLKELFTLLNKINPNRKLTNFVIGGEQIVRQLLPYCGKAHITKILKEFKEVDTTIPNLDQEEGWIMESQTNTFIENGLTYKYVTYTNNDKNPSL